MVQCWHMGTTLVGWLLLLLQSTSCYAFHVGHHQLAVQQQQQQQQQRICTTEHQSCGSLTNRLHDDWKTFPHMVSQCSNIIVMKSSSSSSDEAISPEEADNNDENNGIDIGLDSRLYRVRLPRAPGIEWGTDLSFSFVYVRDLDPTGAAAMSGQVSPNDQLCEIRPIILLENNKESQGEAVNLLGAPFDFVMTSFAGLERNVADIELVFFRGTKDELKALCTGGAANAEPETVTVTVLENKGSNQEVTHTLQAPVGVNVRQLLVDNGINVYQSLTRWTNCKGKQLCGTCIVDIQEGGINTNRKSMDEASTLRTNPDSYRLSCVTFAYGDVTVETFPPVGKDQWTR